MPGTRTTTSVGPILGARYPIDAELVSDEVNLNECDRTASGIVYKEPHGQGKFGAAIVDADGNERHVVVGATAAVAHASRHVVEEPLPREPAKQGNVGEKPLPSTPKKKKNGNPFETLYDADEFPDSTPRPPEYTAPRSSARLSEQRRAEVELMSKAADSWANVKARRVIERLKADLKAFNDLERGFHAEHF